MLPVPATAVAFEPPDRRAKLHQVWLRIKRQIGTGSDRMSDLDLTGTDNTASDSESVGRRGSFIDGQGEKHPGGPGQYKGDEDDEGVDRVVIERTEMPHLWKKGGGTHGAPETADETQSSTQRPHARRKGEASKMETGDADSEIEAIDPTWFEPMMVVSTFCKCRVWPLLLNFFYPRYPQSETEEAFQKELWITSKSTYLCGSLFLIFNVIMQIALLPRPWSHWNEIDNYLLGPLFAVPLVGMVIFDLPRKKPFLWNVMVFISVWITACGNVVDMRLCGYYVRAGAHCGNRDFMSTFYYATAFPILSLFALGQQRIYAFVGICVFISLTSASIIPEHVSFIRNLVNWVVFQAFVLFFHYLREHNDRRLFTLRAELKVQFRAKQRAQIKERKTMAAGRRFSNYLFHEVRVPLNTALLAVQNLKAEGAFNRDPEHEVEYSALDGSLRIMSQVLNDVLDFSRMERGGFSSVSRPFSFHRVMRSIVGPLKLDATSRGLELVTSFDDKIDEVALRAAYAGEDQVDEILAEGSGLVIGDELRLRQIINNLCSNATKFTNAGGKVTVTTKLVYPSSSPIPSPPAQTPDGSYLSDSTLFTHRITEQQNPGAMEVIVVRIEVSDTGAGIRAKDMKDDKLFSAYVQTEIGRSQGGKGTGLGLSLVRQIVSLSGGRLGVKSKIGVGSTFFIELPYQVGPQTREMGDVDFAGVRARIEKDLATPNSYTDDADYGFTLPQSNLTTMAEGDERAEALNMSQLSLVAASIARPPPVFELEMPPSKSSASPSASVIDVTPTPGTPILPSQPSLSPPPSALPSSTLSSPLPTSSFLAVRATSSISEPLSASSSPVPSPSLGGRPAVPMQFANGPLRVLVVDDDALTRKLMSRMLTRIGCEVSSAENGAIGLKMLLANATDPSAPGFDITFLDNQMPVMSGLAVVGKLRELGRHDYVIGVTANAQLQDQEEYIARGASHVLTKPVKEMDLKRLLTVADGLRSTNPPTLTTPATVVESVDHEKDEAIRQWAERK